MKVLAACSILLVILLLFRVWSGFDQEKVKASKEASTNPATPPVNVALLYDHFLEPQESPEEELRALQNLTVQFSLYHKEINTVFYDSNAALTAQLIKHGELSPDHPALGTETSEPLILDRWGSPYILHLAGSKQIQIRSSGPDRRPYTEDDLIQ